MLPAELPVPGCGASSHLFVSCRVQNQGAEISEETGGACFGGKGLSRTQAVASVGAALATGRAAVSEGATSMRLSPLLEEFFLFGTL